MIRETSYKTIENMYDKGESPFRKYFVYEENNQILGYFVIDIIYERMEIVDILVNITQRNRKIGTNMVKYIIDLAKKNNILNITLEVSINNPYAIKLYEKFGFKKVATRSSYYNGVDAILMEVIL